MHVMHFVRQNVTTVIAVLAVVLGGAWLDCGERTGLADGFARKPATRGRIRSGATAETAGIAEIQAMANNVWQSANGDWDTASSWSLGSKPDGTEDAVVFSGISQRSVLTGQTDENLVSIKQLTTFPEYAGNIGAVGAPLHIDVLSTASADSQNITHRGSGTLFYKVPSGLFADVVIDSPNTLDAARLSGDGAYRNIFIKSGAVTITAEPNMATFLIVSGGQLDIEGPQGTGICTTNIVIGGVINNYRKVGSGQTVIVAPGGTWNQYGPILTGAKIINSGGIVNIAPTATGSTNPDLLAIAGFTELADTAYPVDWDSYVIGTRAEVDGDINAGGFFGGLTVRIDLREDYP